MILDLLSSCLSLGLWLVSTRVRDLQGWTHQDPKLVHLSSSSPRSFSQVVHSSRGSPPISAQQTHAPRTPPCPATVSASFWAASTSLKKLKATRLTPCSSTCRSKGHSSKLGHQKPAPEPLLSGLSATLQDYLHP